jgi:hypothetical protein
MHGKDVGEGVTITRAMLSFPLYKVPILVMASPQGLPYIPLTWDLFFILENMYRRSSHYGGLLDLRSPRLVGQGRSKI